MSLGKSEMSENDANVLALAKPARALSAYWVVIGAVCGAIFYIAGLASSVKANGQQIEQMKSERAGESRVVIERLDHMQDEMRRTREDVATLLERTKGK